MLIDSHCHLDYIKTEDELEEVLKRADEHKIEMMLNVCSSLDEFSSVLNRTLKHSKLCCSAGNHPHEASKISFTNKELIELTNNDKVVAIGECGLDYFYDYGDKEDQRKQLRQQIEVARETKLPIIIHNRDSDADMIEILKDEYEKGKFTGVIHCFTSSKELADLALSIGFYISISGIMTFKNAADLRNIIKDIPLDRLLVETDSPYLAPVPKRGKTNEPSFVKYTAEQLAELKNISFNELAKTTTDNFYKLFNKVKRK